MLGTTKPPGETQTKTDWVGEIRPWGFVTRKTNPPNRDSNTSNRWAYLVALLVMKGIVRKMSTER
jgi:hypothetical protein